MHDKDGLAGDFCFIQNEGILSDFERLTYLDESRLSRAGARVGFQLDSLQVRSLVEGFNEDLLIQDAEIYSTQSELILPKLTQPKGVVSPQIIPLHGLLDGEILSISFESLYEPILPRLREHYQKAIENRFFRARWWKHSGGDRLTVVAFHGIHMGDQRTSSLIFQPGILYKAGFDVVLVELPFHGRRSYKSQNLFPNGDLSLLTETILQSAADFQTLRMLLALEGRREVGVLGLSFGGYISLFLSAIHKLSFCIGVAPIVSISDLIIDTLSSFNVRDETKKAVVELCKIHEPLHHYPKTMADNMMIIAGDKDHVSLKESLSNLTKLWALNAVKSELNTGHGLSGQFESYAKKIVAFLLAK